MKPIGKSPSYLIRNPYSYCFRMMVPKDLQKLVGKKEMRYSLKTGYLGVAKNKARFLAGQVQLIFNSLRRGDSVLSKLSDDQIQGLVGVECLKKKERQNHGSPAINYSNAMRFRKLYLVLLFHQLLL
ncbi:MAG: hypothetical protein JSV31_30100 [Desulfobacterales bacterium]|nr:MAG: hypothetical protein JSV31_30100 [Desulfobacterales bacterium]